MTNQEIIQTLRELRDLATVIDARLDRERQRVGCDGGYIMAGLHSVLKSKLTRTNRALAWLETVREVRV